MSYLCTHDSPFGWTSWRFYKKRYNEDSYTGHFLEEDLQFIKKLQEIQNDLPFLLERMKIEKFGQLVCSLDEKRIPCSYQNFAQALDHGLMLQLDLKLN